MPLSNGTRLGPYEVVELLGAGGMGEVYRARDTRLSRDVALKLLPPAFAADPDRSGRFEREARLLAALNHPHIAAIYGLEQADGKRFLVLELVQGEDLAARIARGPIPLEEALPIAREIAEALEYAHEQGIVHRDLKPSNVQLTPEGRVKVLDFGLAKALESDDGNDQRLSQSPTILASSPTVAGVILGTAAYMSPEQARGKRVDKRSDVFAFGSLLHEMLTGRQAFPGETISDTLASVLKTHPDAAALPEDTPRSIRQLLKRCLEKDARLRLRDIGEARIAIDLALQGGSEDTAPHSEVVPGRRSSASAQSSRLGCCDTRRRRGWVLCLARPGAGGPGATTTQVPDRIAGNREQRELSPPRTFARWEADCLHPRRSTLGARTLEAGAAAHPGHEPSGLTQLVS